MPFEKGTKVVSTIGELNADTAGSAVAVVRMEPGRAYAGMPDLLRQVIDEDGVVAREEIR